jgi:hypothetical protein
MSERFPRYVDTEPDKDRGSGELAALVADLELRLTESLERERRLGERFDSLEGEALSRERDLREKLRQYMEFHDRVEISRSWKVLQFFRGLIGRQW